MSIRDSRATERMILELYEIRAVDFGQFKLKSGLLSPYYMDLRLLVSFPHLLQLVSDVMWERLRLIPFDLLVGVPYAALPIATAISLRHNRPIIFVRKERKDHGKGKLIEGIYHKGQHVVMIDDVIADGASKLETIKPLEKENLIVNDVIVLLDRGQGGPEILKAEGYRCHTITTMDEILQVLYKHNRISRDQLTECRRFMKKVKKMSKASEVKSRRSHKVIAATA